MGGREPPFFDEEAAVDDLAKGYFLDKILIDKRLFEIDENEQKGQKWGKKAFKRGGQKNFQFVNFGVKKWESYPFLRMQWRRGDEGYGVSMGIGRGEGGFHGVSSSRYTPDGVPEDGSRPTCRSDRQGRARGFKDNNDHKDIKDTREGTKGTGALWDTWDKKRLRDALALADGARIRARAEQRARPCDSWKTAKLLSLKQLG